MTGKINEAREYLRSKINAVPDTAVILGSGLGGLASSVQAPVVVKYGDIPDWPRPTAPGHEGRLLFGVLEGRSVVIMQGRAHFYEGYTMEEVVFPIRVLGALGVKTLVVTNASGGVNESIAPGSLVAITDHINNMGSNPLRGPNSGELGPRFPDMTYAYDPELLETLKEAAEAAHIPLKCGVYMAFSGPSFETPAEVRMARILGADVVGMSTVPEVIAANHMGIRVCGISCAANYGAGITEKRLTHEEVLEAMEKVAGELSALISEFLRRI